MLRVRVASTGYLGAPGLSTFYFSPTAGTDAEALEASDRVRLFFDSIKNKTPTNVAYTVNPQVDVVTPATGDVTSSLILSPEPLVVQGTANVTNSFPPQVAYLVQWRSSVFESGRRLTGRTFISPIAGFAVNGAPSGAETADVRNAGVALVGAGGAGDLNLVVWRRPRPANSGKNGDLPARAGTVAQVTTVAVPLKFATLNSRRD